MHSTQSSHRPDTSVTSSTFIIPEVQNVAPSCIDVGVQPAALWNFYADHISLTLWSFALYAAYMHVFAWSGADALLRPTARKKT
jgi:hypothetical protein